MACLFSVSLPQTNLRPMCPMMTHRRLTPVLRDGEARYIGDQEIDGTLCRFPVDRFWTYSGVGKLSKYNIFIQVLWPIWAN